MEKPQYLVSNVIKLSNLKEECSGVKVPKEKREAPDGEESDQEDGPWGLSSQAM